jgi:hypothetical protein
VCTSELTADKLVEALNMAQGKIDKASLPVMRELEASKTLVSFLHKKLREDGDKHRQERVELHRKLDDTEIKLHQVSRELASMTDRALKAEHERNDAQARLMEKA